MDIKQITIPEFRDLIKDGAFTVEFYKKDDTLRVMNARLNVHKHVKGTQPEITAKRKATLTAQNMLTVFELSESTLNEERKGKLQYRTINLNRIVRLTAFGQTYRLKESAENA